MARGCIVGQVNETSHCVQSRYKFVNGHLSISAWKKDAHVDGVYAQFKMVKHKGSCVLVPKWCVCVFLLLLCLA